MNQRDGGTHNLINVTGFWTADFCLGWEGVVFVRGLTYADKNNKLKAARCLACPGQPFTHGISKKQGSKIRIQCRSIEVSALTSQL